MDLRIFEDLGLSPAEAKTYLALLDLGQAAAGETLQQSGLQSSVLYRALNSLIEKGIVNYVLVGKRKLYQATEPEHFKHWVNSKLERFNQILPALEQRRLLAQRGERGTIYHGVRGIDEVYRKLREAKGEEYLSFGGGKQCEERMGTAWWNNHHTKRIERQLPARQVFDETVRAFGIELIKRPISRIRYLPAEFAQFQETVIVGDLIAISIFTKQAYSILIQDAVVAEGYTKHFELLWKTAKS